MKYSGLHRTYKSEYNKNVWKRFVFQTCYEDEILSYKQQKIFECVNETFIPITTPPMMAFYSIRKKESHRLF